MGCDYDKPAAAAVVYSFFQYPRTDRMGCDRQCVRLSTRSGRNFQYPRTDRMGCDLRRHDGAGRAAEPFSVLERIEWAATRAVEATPAARRPFSILERIEWAAT